MRLSRSVALGAALAALPLVVGLGFTLDRLQHLATQSERLMLRQLTAVRLGIGVAARLDSLSEYQRKYAVSYDVGYAQKAHEVSRAIDEEIHALVGQEFGTIEARGLRAFADRWAHYRREGRGATTSAELLMSVDGYAPDAPLPVTLQPAPGEIEALAQEARSLLAKAHAAAVADAASAATVRADAWRAAITATAVALLFSATLLILVVRQLRRRLDAFVEGTVAVSQGAFVARLPEDGNDELSRVASAFNRMVTGLAELERLKSDFISSISHELRTPLVAMVETNEALLDDVAGPLTPQQRRMISLNGGAARRLSGMIGDLLELNVVRSGLRYRMAPTNLAEVVRDAVSELDARARDRDITLDMSIEDAGDLHLEADRDRLLQVVQNLVDNAIKYTPAEGTVEIHLRNVAREALSSVPPRATPMDTRFALLQVVDSGPGIPPSDRERVFEKFFRRQGVSADGVGLGLAICREITLAHRGAIWIEDGWLGGACLAVAIPVGTA